MRLDLYGKKPSVSLMMLMCLDMDPFYSIDIRVSSRSMGTVLLWAAMPDLSPTAYRIIQDAVRWLSLDEQTRLNSGERYS